jgi:hypothetical protein
MDVGGPGTAFAALSQPTRHGPGKDPAVLVSVNLTNGSTAPFGRIGKNELILDLAVTVRDEVLYGLTINNELVKFNSADPSTILQTINVTGMQTDEDLVSIDFRPNSGQLYGVGSTGRIYQVNVTTGAATQVGTSTVTPALNGAAFGSDFNPITDRLRVVSNAGQNLRVDPATGEVANNTADAALVYLAGDANFNATPHVVASAHDNNFTASTGTTLFGIDSTLNILVRQGSVQGTPNLPNNGELTTLGALGLDVTDEAGLDISFGSGGVALAVFQKPGESFSRLYRVNLATGAATEMGRVGSTTGVLRDVAIAPPTVQFSVDSVEVDEDAGTARVVLTRSGGSNASAAVTLNSTNGSAIGGQDFIAVTNQTVTFPAGENRAEFFVTLVNDTANESDENFTITLSSPTNGGQLGTPATVTIRIRDND